MFSRTKNAKCIICSIFLMSTAKAVCHDFDWSNILLSKNKTKSENFTLVFYSSCDYKWNVLTWKHCIPRSKTCLLLFALNAACGKYGLRQLFHAFDVAQTSKNKNLGFLPHHLRTRNVHSATFAYTRILSVPNWTNNSKSINLIEMAVLKRKNSFNKKI